MDLVLKNIEIIQRALDEIKEEFSENQVDPYERRGRILKQIFAKGLVDKDELYNILKSDNNTPYQWIGMQAKAGYLVKTATPDGAKYLVTDKAVREFGLDKALTER